jgi:ubiquinone/menaquinone biosynthesis C-methylase UbiE
MAAKTQKELAFLHDLYVATDWGERFAELVDAHVEVPKEGRALYVEAGTGGHALALQERAGTKLELLCSDQNEACLEVARAKAAALNEPTQFRREDVKALSFPDDEFDLVLENASFIRPRYIQSALAEIVRVAKPGGTVAWWAPTASSFGEFFSIYWEALLGAGIEDHAIDVEHLIEDLPTVADAERWAEESGLEGVKSWTTIEEFDYESGEKFINSPLIVDFLLPPWLESIAERARLRIHKELSRIIDEERHSGEFSLTLKATLVMGKKSRVQ